VIAAPTAQAPEGGEVATTGAPAEGAPAEAAPGTQYFLD